MTRTEITFNRKAIKKENCVLVMGYISKLIEDVLNKDDYLSDLYFNWLLGCLSGLELLGVINREESHTLIDNVMYEKYGE